MSKLKTELTEEEFNKVMELIKELNPDGDEKTWNNVIGQIDAILGAFKPVKGVDVKKALKPIIEIATQLETMADEPVPWKPDPERIKEIVKEQREINKRALERGKMFRRVNPETDAKDYMEKLKNKKR